MHYYFLDSFTKIKIKFINVFKDLKSDRSVKFAEYMIEEVML